MIEPASGRGYIASSDVKKVFLKVLQIGSVGTTWDAVLPVVTLHQAPDTHPEGLLELDPQFAARESPFVPLAEQSHTSRISAGAEALSRAVSHIGAPIARQTRWSPRSAREAARSR